MNVIVPPQNVDVTLNMKRQKLDGDDNSAINNRSVALRNFRAC